MSTLRTKTCRYNIDCADEAVTVVSIRGKDIPSCYRCHVFDRSLRRQDVATDCCRKPVNIQICPGYGQLQCTVCSSVWVPHPVDDWPFTVWTAITPHWARS